MILGHFWVKTGHFRSFSAIFGFLSYFVTTLQNLPVQTTTQTYIVTPSKDKEPVFEVTGLPENAERAREEIQSHIATRTGADQLDPDEEFKLNGNETVLPELDLSEKITETSRNRNLIDPFNSNSMRPVKSVTPPGFDDQPNFGTNFGTISGYKTPDSIKLDIFGARQEPSPFEQKSPQQKSPGLFSNPLREAFESPIGADVIQKLVNIDDDDENDEISEFEKDNALEALQKLTPEEKIKLSEVIEKMKREKAEQKKIEDENKMNSIFEPDSLAKQKPAPSIDNVLIGKATVRGKNYLKIKWSNMVFFAQNPKKASKMPSKTL